jgi:hypothetical protein
VSKNEDFIRDLRQGFYDDGRGRHDPIGDLKSDCESHRQYLLEEKAELKQKALSCRGH